MATVTIDQLEEMLEDGETLVINVLDPDQFQRAHIPETENIPISEGDFTERVESRVQDQDVPVVVYCSGPDCEASPRAAEELTQAGFAEVYHYKGGMKEWIEEGNTVERGHGARAI